MIRIFYDTEFTSLEDINADLLSIGFAAESGDDLYIEITDWDRVGCKPSEFVKDVVMPLLGRHNPQRLSRRMARLRITEWLNSLRQDSTDPIALWSDSDIDLQWLTELFVRQPAEQSWLSEMNVVPHITYRVLSWAHCEALNDLIDEYHREHGEQHHALVDARAIRAAMEALLI
jgi:hypothetical protein